MIHLQTLLLNSPEETALYAQTFAGTLKPGDIVALSGGLGAGKTTFCKAAISTLLNISPNDIQSPTFTYLHTYENSSLTIHHFDLYRLKDENAFIALGFLDFFQTGAICFLEWADKIRSLLPPHTYFLSLSPLKSEHTREITLEKMSF